MKRALYSIFFGLLISVWPVTNLLAQTENQGWKISVGGGFMNYYGDVSPYHIADWSDWSKAFKFFQYQKYYTPEASFGISLENRFSPGMGVLIQVNRGVFSMSDRYRKNNGDFAVFNEHWNRALNFKTQVIDVGLALVFHSDNGKLLPEDFFVSPYFFVGAGMLHFKVKGDLYDADGNPYDYFDPEVHPDGVYETDLRDIKTENDSKYSDFVPYADLGIGLKFRLSQSLSILIQTDVKYAFSDYLDDVSGTYKATYSSAEQFYAAHPGTNPAVPGSKRGADNGVNDFYIFNKAALQISLGNGKRKPRVSAPVIYKPKPLLALQKKQKDSLEQAQKAGLAAQKLQDSLRHIRQQDSVRLAQKKQSDVDSIHRQLRQLHTEMLSMRFVRSDQDLIIRKNETQYQIDSLKRLQRSLREKPQLTEADSLQAHMNQDKIDRLYLRRKAIQQAREQLRRDLANTPIVTEYPDSTQIIIYKNRREAGKVEQELRDDEKLGEIRKTQLQEELDSLSHVQSSPKTHLDSIHEAKRNLQQKLDSLHSSSVLGSKRDSLATDSLRSQKITALQQMYDSLKNSYAQDSLNIQKNRARKYRRQAEDSLQRLQLQGAVDSLRIKQDSINRAPERGFFERVFGKKEETSEVEKRQLRLQQQQIDSLQTVRDSLVDGLPKEGFFQKLFGKQKQRSVEARERIDAQKRSLDSIQHAQDSIREEMPKKGFFNRLFGNNQKQRKEEMNNTYEQEIAQKQAEIERLNKEMKGLKTQQQNPHSDAQLRELQHINSAINSLKHNNKRSGINVTPSVAPVIVPGRGRKGKNYDDELEDIRKRLEALQTQQDSTQSGEATVLPRINEMTKVENDSLTQTEIDGRLLKKNTEITTMQAKLEALEKQMVHLQQAQERYSGKEKSFENFPVISTYFAIGSATVSTQQIGQLRSAAIVAQNNASVSLVLKGFTDGTGSKSVNQRVATQRCQAVKSILVDKFGVSDNQIRVEPMGTTSSLRGSNPMDRRVDISVVSE